MWYIGVALGVSASMMGTIGKQLMRFSELQRRKNTPAGLHLAQVSLFLGLSLNTVVGPLTDMSAYGFAPQSLIAPLGALDVVWNTLSAPCTLGEQLTRRKLLGCCAIFIGAVATSIVGVKEEEAFTLQYTQDTLLRPAVLIYMACLASWVLFNILVLMPRSKNPPGEPWETGDRLRGLSLGMTAGSIAGNMFCVKAFVELVISSFNGQAAEIWTHWLPYVLLLGAVFFALSNLYFLTQAMREYEAIFMGAVFEGSLVVAASVSGCIVFRELEGQAWSQIIVFWLALATIVTAILFLCQSSHASQVPDPAGNEAMEMKSKDMSCPEAPFDSGLPVDSLGRKGEVDTAGASESIP